MTDPQVPAPTRELIATCAFCGVELGSPERIVLHDCSTGEVTPA